MFLLDADRDGLASLIVQSREVQDPYENVEELISHLIILLDQRPLDDPLEVIKGLYQLQDAIGLSDAAFACVPATNRFGPTGVGVLGRNNSPSGSNPCG